MLQVQTDIITLAQERLQLKNQAHLDEEIGQEQAIEISKWLWWIKYWRCKVTPKALVKTYTLKSV